MREIRPYSSEGGGADIRSPYLYSIARVMLGRPKPR